MFCLTFSVYYVYCLVYLTCLKVIVINALFCWSGGIENCQKAKEHEIHQCCKYATHTIIYIVYILKMVAFTAMAWKNIFGSTKNLVLEQFLKKEPFFKFENFFKT